MAQLKTSHTGDNGALDESAIFGALYACAANPENWDQLIAVLKSEVPDAGDLDAQQAALAERLSRAEDLAWRLSEPDRLTVQDPLPPVPFAYLILADGRRILGCNDLFVRQVAPILGKIVRGGRLKIESAENEDALTDATRRLARTAVGRTALHLKDLSGETWHVGYLAQASALPAPIRRALAGDLGGETAALVLLFPGETSQRLAIDVVQKGFGLTPAEARLAIRLKDGLSISEAAEAIGVSVNTARNQLRSIFQKIGVNRQSELVRSLTQLSSFATRIWAEDIDDRVPAQPVETPRQQLMKLSDGRRLAYRSYGPITGRPILYFHEGAGSSLLMPDNWTHCGTDNIRILAVERPGFGLSDPAPAYSFDGVARDMVEFLDTLTLDRVALVGIISGASFALATAARLGSRATRVVLCSGRPPVRPEAENEGTSFLFRQFRGRMSSHPWLVDTFYTILRARLSHAVARRMIRNSATLSADDLAFIDRRPDVVDFVAAYVAESLAVSARGVADELRCFAREDGCNVSGLTCPVIAYHGDRDALVPLDDLRAFLTRLPNAEVRIQPGAGHLLGFRIAKDLATVAVG